ncbi:hypothetical protein NQZ79_g8463 [Umbelopsis isabellina]|nr:hypothetical protein NQZ79_g8463 [Umbelopsis isabellina]
MTGPGTPETDFPQPIQPPPLAVANENDCIQVIGSAPTFSYSPANFDIQSMQQLPASTVSPSTPLMSVAQHDGRSRFCEHCQRIKPDRAHHCRECDSCTLKMDHHCPWVSGCVGHGNYKFFFLFVLYTSLYSLWVFGTTLPTIIIAVLQMGNPVDVQWIVCVVLAFLWGFLLLAFSCIHGYYILTNTTTIESISDRPYFIRVDYDRSGHNYQLVSTDIGIKLWSLGMAANWRSVMGNNPWAWFFPIKNVLGNGFTYPFDPHVYHNMVERAAQQSRMSTTQSQLPNDSSIPTSKSPPADSNNFPMNQRNGSASELLV